MKKTVASIIFLLFFLPAAGEASYLIRFKNGGELQTPLYWYEGRELHFFYGGGSAGIGRALVERIEKIDESMRGSAGHGISTVEYTEKRVSTSSPSPAEMPLETGKTPVQENAPQTKAAQSKETIADMKGRKDRLTTELNDLLDRRREALQRKDVEAQQRLTDELTNISSEIYGITDQATEKNKGKLPEGWWNK